MTDAMTDSDRAYRKRIKTAEAALVIAVLLLALGIYLIMKIGYTGDEALLVAVISRDGSVIKTIDLSAVEKPYEIYLEDGRGINIVEVEQGRIRVSDADCPDRICVNTGWIDKPGIPIACVPHGLTIVIEQKGDFPGGPDAVSR